MDIKDLEKNYDFEFDKVINEIKKKKCKRVLLQFPDGLKMYATSVVDFLESKTKDVEFLIWLGNCFGACDTPSGIDNLKIDLVVQFGHNELQPSYL